MAYRGATVDSLLPRRRIGRSELTALVAAVLAWALGAAAWLTEASSSTMGTTAVAASFEDRFVPLAQPQSFRPSPALQPLDRSALAEFDSKLRDAKGLLAQQLLFSDWRVAAETEEEKPAGASDIPLPRSRPAAADVQVALDTPPPPPRPESRSMLQRLSDLLPDKLTLASLTPNSGLFQHGPDLAALGYDGQTAVYDISAHAVYLPNGTTLEAHSGLGRLRDDPDHVDQRMVGATPPATYELKPREQLFHGVRALRMLPVDGSSTLGRAGLLAHSYMLGPEGDSNGCVSIRDYDRFRKAYDNGEISRLVVVPSLATVQAQQRATSQS
ncbi:MAG TPA: DUF2778 domain-containing protein [Bradyrhizobium sp.]|uniref:DUF2778 domain-containing protein n=1 Tax=Bradyrhizobium sp. TaxID=376 RepID=UPI002CEFC50D|nr:DUF2778 domain-containing protein [Bradyrhizobium sp.]HLZ00801.1 DUF2778 domain-containing protein [Bradyrhizobium sp.]